MVNRMVSTALSTEVITGMMMATASDEQDSSASNIIVEASLERPLTLPTHLFVCWKKYCSRSTRDAFKSCPVVTASANLNTTINLVVYCEM
jgi:hypothetical protein